MRINCTTKRGKVYKTFLYISLGMSILSLGGTWIWDVWNKVPSNIHVRAGMEQH